MTTSGNDDEEKLAMKLTQGGTSHETASGRGHAPASHVADGDRCDR